MTQQPIAEPAGEPLPALVGTCANCQRRITRLGLESARWRHDDDTVICTVQTETSFDELVGNGKRRPR